MIRTRTGYWRARGRAATAAKPKRKKTVTYNPLPLDWEGTKKEYKEHQKDKAQEYLDKLTSKLLALHESGKLDTSKIQ